MNETISFLAAFVTIVAGVAAIIEALMRFARWIRKLRGAAKK